MLLDSELLWLHSCGPLSKNCLERPTLVFRVGRNAAYADRTASERVRSVPRAWSALGEFCCARRMASSRVMSRPSAGSSGYGGTGVGVGTGTWADKSIGTARSAAIRMNMDGDS